MRLIQRNRKLENTCYQQKHTVNKHEHSESISNLRYICRFNCLGRINLSGR